MCRTFHVITCTTLNGYYLERFTFLMIASRLFSIETYLVIEEKDSGYLLRLIFFLYFNGMLSHISQIMVLSIVIYRLLLVAFKQNILLCR